MQPDAAASPVVSGAEAVLLEAVLAPPAVPPVPVSGFALAPELGATLAWLGTTRSLALFDPATAHACAPPGWSALLAPV